MLLGLYNLSPVAKPKTNIGNKSNVNCLNKNQALKRSDSSKKDKGGEASKAVLSVLGC